MKVLTSTTIDLRKELIGIFKKHIGEQRGIGIQEILDNLYPENRRWNFWKQLGYREIIKKAIIKLRCDYGILIISRGNLYFIPKEQHEVDYYKNTLKRNIKSMKKSINKADNWIIEEKWKKL